MEIPAIRYARSGGVSIAYQITGEGKPIDLVFAPGTVSHLGLPWQATPGRVPPMIERLSRFARLIRFDKRGTGMSDRSTDAATLEERADDIRAVMDAAGSAEAVILGGSEGGSMACMFAAMHPERTRSLIVWGCQARFVRTPEYPYGQTEAVYEDRLSELERDWPSRDYIRSWGAGLGPHASEEDVDRTLGFFQMAATPAAIVALERTNGALDIRDILPAIRVPTLVLARIGDPIVEADAVRDLAARIDGAEIRFLDGDTHAVIAPWLGIDGEDFFSAVEEWVTGTRPALPSERFLTTLLFVDLAGSTEHAARIGDRAWRELLDQHYAAVGRALAEANGRQIDTAGDGLLATFDGPARAIRCAFEIERADRALGLAARAGVHTGEVERSGEAIRGIAVHLAARVAAAAAPDTVFTTSTVRDLTAGSGLRFEDRGLHTLKGIEGARQLLAVFE
ncbi:MAG: adenylate/guanylate cyclase domain-containing protein [Candidatus Limnocylindrales bacterium]